MRRAPIIVSVAAAVLGCAAMAVAQPNTNPNAQNAPYPQQPTPRARANEGGQPVDTRVNREMYGNEQARVPLYGPQFQPLPSEALIATQRSGVLPSELEMNAQAVGPLAPYGAASYIPSESPLQRANRVRPPALWGPTYVGRSIPGVTGTPAPVPAPDVQQDVVPGERKSEAPVSPQYIAPVMIQPQPVPSGYRINGQASSYPREGMTTYRILPRTHPLATQPATTQPTPSLSEFQK